MMETAKLFVNGNSQAVRLPKEYRFRGDEVVIKRMGNAVVLLPKDDPWQVMFDALGEFPVIPGRSCSMPWANFPRTLT